jgi:Ca-activated chloride channel family protein
MTLFGITWAYTRAFYFFPLLIAALVIMVRRYHRVIHIIAAFKSKRQSALFSHNLRIRSLIKLILMSVGLATLFLTLLHPQWGKKEEKIVQEGRDLFIALDISRSMLAQDIKPHRLACAKEKIKRLTELLDCERAGLLLFSGSSFVQCPLTQDYSAFHMFLDTVDAETISSGTTALDQAINKVISIFSSMPAKKNKLLVIFTDGEDFSSNLSGIKQKAQEIGLHIFTIGVGTTQGAPIPLFDEHGKHKGVQHDAKGAIVISRINEGILKTLSRDTGAQYIKATADHSDVERLVAAVHAYEKEKLEDKKFERSEEQYPWFLLVSFICFLIEWIL